MSDSDTEQQEFAPVPMPVSVPPPTVYLVAIDETSTSSRAIEIASKLGAALGGNAELHIVHVLDITTASPVMSVGMLPPPGDLLDAGRSLLDQACKEAAVRFGGKVVGHFTPGSPWQDIVQMAANLNADLIVVGTAGRTGVARMALGSVAEMIVRHAGCPVLVVRPKDYGHKDAGVGIEPPCAACVDMQIKTSRAQLWCARHATRHPHGHLHYEFPQPFAVGSSTFQIPE